MNKITTNMLPITFPHKEDTQTYTRRKHYHLGKSSFAQNNDTHKFVIITLICFIK